MRTTILFQEAHHYLHPIYSQLLYDQNRSLHHHWFHTAHSLLHLSAELLELNDK